MYDAQSENKKKHIGFRLPVADYIKIVKKADALGTTITDYLLSLIYPSINSMKITEPISNKISEETAPKKAEIIVEQDKPLKQSKIIFNSIKTEKLFSEENEKLLNQLT